MTHLCVLMANYLTGAGQRRTAVIEWNDHGDFRRMEKVCARRENVAGKKEENVFKALGVAYYKQGEACVLAGCMNGPYDDVIIDFGESTPGAQDEWLHCQVKFALTNPITEMFAISGLKYLIMACRINGACAS